METTVLEKTRPEEFELSTGKRYELPIRYLDWACMNALFTAPVDKIRELLPSRKLKPLLLMPGKALITLMAMEYRKIENVEPYNEFMVGIMTQYTPKVNIPGWLLLFHPLFHPARFRKFGVYVHRLPVTTQEAYEAGVEVWGYRKTVNEISFEDQNDYRCCKLRTGGVDDLMLKVKKIATKEQRIDLYSYSVKGDQLLWTRIETQGEYGIRRLPGGASLTLHEGPIAEELRSLGVGKVALGCFYGTNLKSLLHPAKEYLTL